MIEPEDLVVEDSYGVVLCLLVSLDGWYRTVNGGIGWRGGYRRRWREGNAS